MNNSFNKNFSGSAVDGTTSYGGFSSNGNSDTISFDKQGLSEIAQSFDKTYGALNDYCSQITKNVDILRSGIWSGSEFEKANVELQNIEKSVLDLQDNCKQIRDAIGTVSSNFNEVSYRN